MNVLTITGWGYMKIPVPGCGQINVFFNVLGEGGYRYNSLS